MEGSAEGAVEGAAVAGDFVQLGATRDGLDPYLDCARRRSLRAVLVETPAYLRWRRLLGRRPFDLEIGVEEPQDPEQVRKALADAQVRPVLLLSGFERYVYAGFALAQSLRTLPWPSVGEEFRPLDKHELRTAVREVAGHLPQPRQQLLGPSADEGDAGEEAEELGYPQVIKPVDGGGGLGVFLVQGAEERRDALRHIERLANYGGGAFTGVIAEEFVKGPEVSLQGVAHDGNAVLLSVCEKFTAVEDGTEGGTEGEPDEPAGFREVGHIARHGSTATAELLELTQSCVDAAGYHEGPFHIDAILGADGPVLVEMGFRLSGGALVALIERATGLNWAELTFRVHLDGADPRELIGTSGTATAATAGQIRATSEEQLAAAAGLSPAGCSLDIVPAGPAPSAAGLTDDERTTLASDIARHGGSVGRVVVTSDQGGDVRSVLSFLADNRRRA
ncbi:acetyl-CoA carboxylase biotin carboxylase subunit family protein [Streptomyces sp. UNOC14_S4]|uniref:ATP-grasp domain-containing protein n=1 Tax=Streptomyces sp. UNOC14_S4 TaxID=2872340 RepID=UPI001E4851D6|nr:ATP-grasp domain-containing protein [Streptomyces sp. UNOC14_S4]MCC3766441.1 ATP-grasp domain-containing protein [Streptomyces sp. UNOC14_S4]